MLYIMYFLLLLVYFAEYPRMFVTIGANRSTKIGQFVAHLMMCVLSVAVVWDFGKNFSLYTIIYGEYFFGALLIAIIGTITSFGALIVLLRSYANPKYRFI